MPHTLTNLAATGRGKNLRHFSAVTGLSPIGTILVVVMQIMVAALIAFSEDRVSGAALKKERPTN